MIEIDGKTKILLFSVVGVGLLFLIKLYIDSSIKTEIEDALGVKKMNIKKVTTKEDTNEFIDMNDLDSYSDPMDK